MIRAKIMKMQCEWRRLGKPWFKRWSEVLNRENPGRLKGWRVVVKVWNSHCMHGVWSSRTMEILWVGWAQLRLEACDFCTPAYLHGCTAASQPPAARTVKAAWIPGWGFAWEALSMDWKCRRVETDSDKGISVIVHVVLFHFWVYTLLMRVKKESEKTDLKLNIQNENHGIQSHRFSSVQFSRSVVSDSLRPHELQHARPPCPSPTPRVYPKPCPSSQWCHPVISSSSIPFSSCPQSFSALMSFPMSQLFAWGGQSTGVSASASVLPVNTQDWSPLGWTGWISLQFKGLSRVFSNTTVQKHQFFSTKLSL